MMITGAFHQLRTEPVEAVTQKTIARHGDIGIRARQLCEAGIAVGMRIVDEARNDLLAPHRARTIDNW